MTDTPASVTPHPLPAGREPTPTELERHVRGLLRGCRLVCEAALDVATWQRVFLTVSSLTRSREPADVGREYPALFATYVVESAARRSDGQDVWTPTGWPQKQHARAGAALEEALTALGLERFPWFFAPGAAPTRRFASIILAHGGMPRSLAAAFIAEVLLPALRRGQGATGADLVAAWRASPPRVPRTVERFLLHGGATTVDLLDRLIDAIRADTGGTDAGDDLGLPAHLRAAVAGVPQAERGSRLRLLSRPRVSFDPYGGAGPDLLLPALARDLAPAVTWRIGTGAAAPVERRGSAYGDTRVPLSPADWWGGAAPRRHGPPLDLTIECFGASPMIAFDGQDGAYLPDTAGLRSTDAWIITAPGITLHAPADGALRPLGTYEPGVPLRSAWASHRVGRYDLRGVEAIVLREGEEERDRVPVTQAMRPHLQAAPVRDVRGLAGGEEVFAEAPDLYLPAWGPWVVSLAAVGPDGALLHRWESTFDTTERALHLPLGRSAESDPAAAARRSDGFGRYEVTARGPIGSDLRRSYVLVPGLSVDTPALPLPPGTGDTEVAVAAGPAIGLAGRPVGEGVRIRFTAGQVEEQIWAWLGRDRKVGLSLHLPRLRWSLRRAGAPVADPGSDVIACDPATLDPGDALVIETGRPAMRTRLDILDGTGDVVQEGTFRPTAADGRIEVLLDPCIDTLRGTPLAVIALTIGDAHVRLVAPPRPAPCPAADAAPAAPGPALPAFGAEVSGTVVRADPGGLTVDLGGSIAHVHPERLPRPAGEFRAGERITGVVVHTDPLRLDLRPFDPAQFRRGEDLVVRVAGPRGDAIMFTMPDGTDGIAGPAELPPGGLVGALRPGTTAAARVVRCEARPRRWRLTLAPEPPGHLLPGAAVEAIVRMAVDMRVVVDLPGATGIVESPDLPDGRSPGSFRRGERLAARVLSVDRTVRVVHCTLRPFNPTGIVVDQAVWGTVSFVGPGGLHLRLDTGDPAFVPTELLPADRGADARSHYGRDTRVEGRVTRLEADRYRIVVSLRPAGGTYVFGADADDNPFAILRQAPRQPG